MTLRLNTFPVWLQVDLGGGGANGSWSLRMGYAACMQVVDTEMKTHEQMLLVAMDEARTGLAEGGIPIGAAIFDRGGRLLSSGRNRRIQQNDPSMHAETDAFRRAGRQRSYSELIMVTTLAPCWYCSGLVRQFGFGTLVAGESNNFYGGLDWLRSAGVEVIDLASPACTELLASFIREHRDVWHEDIGQVDEMS